MMPEATTGCPRIASQRAALSPLPPGVSISENPVITSPGSGNLRHVSVMSSAGASVTVENACFMALRAYRLTSGS